MAKQLRDFIDPNHLLIGTDERLDFSKLVAPLEDCYCPRLWQAGDPSRGDGEGAAHLLAVQHRVISTAVLGHLGEHLLPLILFPGHR